MSAQLQDLTPGRSQAGATPSPGRVLVEKLLRASTAPLTPAEIASRTGLDVATVRSYLGHMLTKGTVCNVAPGSNSGSAYLWTNTAAAAAPARPPVLRSVATPRPEVTPWRDRPHYDGAELRAYTGRPGAMRAFDLPSLVNGKAVPRARPVIMGAKAREAA